MKKFMDKFRFVSKKKIIWIVPLFLWALLLTGCNTATPTITPTEPLPGPAETTELPPTATPAPTKTAIEAIALPAKPTNTPPDTMTAIQFVIDDSGSYADCDSSQKDLLLELPTFALSLMTTYEHVFTTNETTNGPNHSRLFMGVLRYKTQDLFEPIQMASIEALNQNSGWKKDWFETLRSPINPHTNNLEAVSALITAQENLNRPEFKNANKKIVFVTDGIFREEAFRQIKETLIYLGDVEVYFVLLCKSDLLFSPAYQNQPQYQEIKEFILSPTNKLLAQPFIDTELPVEKWAQPFFDRLLAGHLPDETQGAWIYWKQTTVNGQIRYTLPLSFTGQARHYEMALVSFREDLAPQFDLDEARQGVALEPTNLFSLHWFYNSASKDGPLSPPGNCMDHMLTISTEHKDLAYYFFEFTKPSITIALQSFPNKIVLEGDINPNFDVIATINSQMPDDQFDNFAACFEAVIAANVEGEQIMGQPPTPIQKTMTWEVSIPLDKNTLIQLEIYLRPLVTQAGNQSPPLFTYSLSLPVEFQPQLMAPVKIGLNCPEESETISACPENTEDMFYAILDFAFKGPLNLEDELAIEFITNKGNDCYQSNLMLNQRGNEGDDLLITPSYIMERPDYFWQLFVYRPENPDTNTTLAQEFLNNCGDIFISWIEHDQWPTWTCEILSKAENTGFALNCEPPPVPKGEN